MELRETFRVIDGEWLIDPSDLVKYLAAQIDELRKSDNYSADENRIGRSMLISLTHLLNIELHEQFVRRACRVGD